MSKTEDESNRDYDLGQIVGFESCAKLLSGKAAEYFSAHQDELAREFRRTATLIETMKNTMRRDYDKKYHARKS